MLIDLKLNNKTVMVIGGGKEAYRKTQSFLDSGAKIWVISRSFSTELLKLCENKKVALLKTEINDARAFVANLNPKPDALLAVTGDSKLNLELVKEAKACGSIVYAVDNPAQSDFILPAVAKVGDVKVAISTSGKSPAMARLLRQRVERMITSQDLLEIELQSLMRKILKEKVPDSNARSKVLYEILNNDNIKQALKQSKLKEAQELAMDIVRKKEIIH